MKIIRNDDEEMTIN